MIHQLSSAEREIRSIRSQAFRGHQERSPLRGSVAERPQGDAQQFEPVPSQPTRRPQSAAKSLTALVIIFALLNAADLASTFVGLHNGMSEGNPLMSALLARYGFTALVVYKAAVVAAVALGVHMLRNFRFSVARTTILICDLLVLFVVILNVAQYLLIA